jgi:hypothetical protein
MIWLSEYRDFFNVDSLRIGYEKIQPLTSVIFQGDHHYLRVVCNGQ